MSKLIYQHKILILIFVCYAQLCVGQKPSNFSQLLKGSYYSTTNQDFITTGEKYSVLSCFSYEDDKFKKMYFDNYYKINKQGLPEYIVSYSRGMYAEYKGLSGTRIMYDNFNREESTTNEYTTEKKYKKLKIIRDIKKAIETFEQVQWNEASRIQYEYDSLNLLKNIILPIGATPNTISYQYRVKFEHNMKQVIGSYNNIGEDKISKDSTVFIQDSIYYFRDYGYWSRDKTITLPSQFIKKIFYHKKRGKYLVEKYFYLFDKYYTTVFNNEGFPIVKREKNQNLTTKYYYNEDNFLVKESSFVDGKHTMDKLYFYNFDPDGEK